MLNFLFIKAPWRAKYQIIKFSFYLHRLSDEAIIAHVDRERICRGWCAQRSYFLAALRYECERRGIAYIK